MFIGITIQNLIYLLENLGVLESGFLIGALILTIRGIGKSTPTIKASPSPNIGRKDKKSDFKIRVYKQMRGEDFYE